MSPTSYKEDDAIALIDHPSRESLRRMPESSKDWAQPLHQATHRGSQYVKHKINDLPTLKKLLIPGLIRSLISWLLIASFYIVMWHYKNQILSSKTKSKFDAITVALSLALGLNVASGLKCTALDLRWWILSFEKRPSREVELIMRCDSMTELLRLIFVAPRPRTVSVAVFWIALNILLQAGIATLGLTYTASPGVSDIYREPGTKNISVADLARFAPKAGRFGSDLRTVESFAAHTLGDIGSSYNFSALPDAPLENTPLASNPAGFWNATDHWEYIFLDSAPASPVSEIHYLAIYSDRVARASAVCAIPPFEFVADGKQASVRLLENNRSIVYPLLFTGQESIIYLTTPMKNKEINGGICGPGCANVKILEPAAGPPADDSPFKGSEGNFFYDCNVTVSADVSVIPSINAAVAAQAIALSGKIHPEFQDTNDTLNQFTAYNFGNPFGEPQNNSASGMASLVSRFAIGVISAAAQTNPPRYIQGGRPAQGVQLKFETLLGFNLVLLATGAIQLGLVIMSAILVRRVTIPEEIPLSRQETIQNQFVSDI